MSKPEDPAAGLAPMEGEPPLHPPPAAEPEVPETTDPVVEQVLAPVHDRCGTDRVFAAEVAPFLDGPWRVVGFGAVRAEVGRRYCKVTGEQVEIGHVDFQGSKRIPL